jgi:uncharacterized protein YciW
VDHIMGHARDDMGNDYRKRISDERLKAVTDYVRVWLFAPPKKDKAKPKETQATIEVVNENESRQNSAE